MNTVQIKILSMTTEELHQAILDRKYDHGDLERGIMARIAGIPRYSLSRDGCWWSYPKARAYPYGN